jgi:hypothetical protein
MARTRSWLTFVIKNTIVWLLMTVTLIVVPDTLERWMPLEIARVLGWALACGLWVVAVEQEWKARFGPFTRFLLQLVLWVGSAMLALWVSDAVRVTVG